ncbi:MAG: hypothetical protein DRP64_18000 [Verrucomicrobia bacterium]|nr:MAG: hypothetical protein DRP64_18000 [Verrucomicrobiota bacterium]
MEVVNLGAGGTFGLLVFVTADSLGMVQIADCHSFSLFVLKSFEGNDNQLLFSIQERLQGASKKRTSEKSRNNEQAGDCFAGLINKGSANSRPDRILVTSIRQP